MQPDGSDVHLTSVSDEAAFTEFYSVTRPKIVGALAVNIGDRDLAVEATDEALARAFQRWSKVTDLDNPGGWVYRVALNWATSVLRTRRRRSSRPLFTEGSVDPPTAREPALMQAMAKLEDGQRAVVTCRYLMDWSVSETADALGIREGTVKSRLHRGLAVLRAELGHLAPEER